jgi:peptidoglycan/LPS O-acetylase OafA/YrhL
MFYHFNLVVEDTYIFWGVPAALARSGWCGVDLFFVLSGFLITGILLDSRGASHYFRNFYARRVLRIFPLYYGLLALVFLVGPRVSALATPKFDALARNQLPLWFYYMNLSIAWHNDFYFSAEWIEFNHFWSLAIEEQFYLGWPAVVLLCGRRALTAVCVSLIAVALLLRGVFVLSGDYISTVYALTPCRWDGLALGGLLALASRTPGWWAPLARQARLVAIACFFVLAGLAAQWNGLIWDKPFVQIFGYSLLAILFGALIVLAVNTPVSSIVGRAWSHSILRFFGKYSYGLYVVHPNVMEHLMGVLPMETWVQWSGTPTLAVLSFMGTALCLSVILAWLSWHLYEKHFLKLKALFQPAGSRSDMTPAGKLRAQLEPGNWPGHSPESGKGE